VELVHQDGAGFRSAGVCYQNLNVYGYGGASDYQGDVANVWLSLSDLVGRVTGRKRQRIDILRNFDGVVHKGEMLVVLGPPGAGCSTTLKTIAGELNGIYVDEGSYFNYQGESNCNFCTKGEFWFHETRSFIAISNGLVACNTTCTYTRPSNQYL
jgi:hypothetical protein